MIATTMNQLADGWELVKGEASNFFITNPYLTIAAIVLIIIIVAIIGLILIIGLSRLFVREQIVLPQQQPAWDYTEQNEYIPVKKKSKKKKATKKKSKK